MQEERQGYIKIKKTYIVIGAIIAASFLGGWFASFFILAPQLGHLANSTGYQQGYRNGYTDSIKDIYNFNNLPQNLVVSDKKNGLAVTNGTAVTFLWIDPATNHTLGLNITAREDMGQKRIGGTLYLMTSPVKWPQQVATALNMTQKQYFVLQTSDGQRYLLDSLK